MDDVSMIGEVINTVLDKELQVSRTPSIRVRNKYIRCAGDEVGIGDDVRDLWRNDGDITKIRWEDNKLAGDAIGNRGPRKDLRRRRTASS